MAAQLIECAPNFSEGRDAGVVAAIGAAIASVEGARVPRSEMDPDHNRSVITFAATLERAGEAAFAGIQAAVERIDPRRHSGVHPRMGASDVTPFVPLTGATLAECVEIARRAGERVWTELRVPVYFYEDAASRDADWLRAERKSPG